MPFAVLREQLARGVEMRVLTNTGEDIENLAPVRLRVLHAICGQDRQSIMSGKIDKWSINAFFAAQKMALNLNENIFATESVDEKLRAICEVLGSARALACWFWRLAERNLRKVRGDEASETAREARALPRNAIIPSANSGSSSHRTAHFPFSLRKCAWVSSSHKFLYPVRFLHQHRQNAAVLHAQFATDNGTHVVLACRDRKTLRAINTVAIEHGQRRHLELGRGLR